MAISVPMAHDVFISHAHKDIDIAKAICGKFESAQIKCWVAQRDILAGEDWTVATRKAIESSRVVLLLVSENANAATHLEREIAHAFYTKRTILPVRLTEWPLKRDFLFYLGDVRWFDASQPVEEQSFDALIASVKDMLQKSGWTGNALPDRTASEVGNSTRFSGSWVDPSQTSRSWTVEMIKKISVAVIVLSGIWLIWYIYMLGKGDEPPAEGDQHVTRSVPVPPRDSASPAAVDASPTKPQYTYSRFGLWVEANSSPTPLAREGAAAAHSTAIVPEGALSSSPPDVGRESRGETAKSTAVDSGDAKSAQEKSSETADQTPVAGPADSSPSGSSNPSLESAPLAESTSSADPGPSVESPSVAKSAPLAESTPPAYPSPSVESLPATKSAPLAESTAPADPSPSAESLPATKSAPLAESTPPAVATPAVESSPAAKSAALGESTPPAPSAESTKSTSSIESAEVGDGFRSSSEEQSLKQLVLDYMRTVASDDDSAQERFFAWRVNFFGKGVLPISGVRASMDRYRKEWPDRDWEPDGEPEFSNVLHSIHPELYEVLQPFAWTVANGSQRKRGRAILYVRIRRDDKGSLRIIHLELRQPGENSSR
jgi:hypothetical protein